MTDEIWRDIDGYEGLYQVSNFGRVKRFYKTKPPRILKQSISQNGYPNVNLCKDNSRQLQLVHRLVATAFIPNPDGKPQINHRDGDKRNNHAGNLEWCTAKENQQHSIKNGLRKIGSEHRDAKLSKEEVLYIRNNPDELTGRELARKFKVVPTVIEYVQTGKSYKTIGGTIRNAKTQSPRLSNDVRNEIRHLYVKRSTEFGIYGLGRKYGVHPSTIWNIINKDD